MFLLTQSILQWIIFLDYPIQREVKKTFIIISFILLKIPTWKSQYFGNKLERIKATKLFLVQSSCLAGKQIVEKFIFHKKFWTCKTYLKDFIHDWTFYNTDENQFLTNEGILIKKSLFSRKKDFLQRDHIQFFKIMFLMRKIMKE